MITARTPTYALLGDPVAASRSPALHNGWFAHHDVDGVYVALRVPATDGAALVQAFRTLGLAGANLTVPHKVAAVPHVDALEPTARRAGAVNTLWWDRDVLTGANTDGDGLLAALHETGVTVCGRTATVVGTGGAGRGVAEALLRAGVDRLTLRNRTAHRAEDLAAQLGDRVTAGPLTGAIGTDLVVVCTSADTALTPAPAPPGAVWCDIRVGATPPRPSAAAARHGYRVLDGAGMLRWQAALAFERWTGISPEP